jgi:DNA invertase Pin-like site-specific DNA recombinase
MKTMSSAANKGGRLSGLERAKAQGRVGGRPKVKRDKDKDAKAIRRLRAEGQSYAEIAEELGRSKADIYRVASILGCQSDRARTESPMNLA